MSKSWIQRWDDENNKWVKDERALYLAAYKSVLFHADKLQEKNYHLAFDHAKLYIEQYEIDKDYMDTFTWDYGYVTTLDSHTYVVNAVISFLGYIRGMNYCATYIAPSDGPNYQRESVKLKQKLAELIKQAFEHRRQFFVQLITRLLQDGDIVNFPSLSAWLNG